MYNFEYVCKKELSPIKNELISIINEVQNIVRDDFTFSFVFIGSCKRNMVTYDPKSNIGFDFDVNIEIQWVARDFSAKETKEMLISAFNKAARKYGYDYAENSTRVITIKVKDFKNSKILHSCDFAIVKNYTDDEGNRRQEYIRYCKKSNSYCWAKQPDGFYLLPEKAQWIKDNDYQDELRRVYLNKKNRNAELQQSSRSLYAQAVNEVCQRGGYFNEDEDENENENENSYSLFSLAHHFW